MVKVFSEWKVLPHGAIQELAENLWWVQGSLPGMSLKRVMTVVRLEDGRLVIHNGIALDEAAMARIEAWGKPSFLVVPNAFHRLDALAYKKRYPSIQVLSPRGGRRKIENVVPVDSLLEDFPTNDTIAFEVIPGVGDLEMAMSVRSADGVSLVLADTVFNMDRKRDLFGFLITTIFGSAPGPRVTRLARLMLVKDKAALREELERLATLPDLIRLIVAHENIAQGREAAAALRQAATYL